MEHHEVEALNLTGAYLAGKLPPEQAEAFEIHMLDCARCFERVRWDDEMRQGLRAAAASELASEAIVRSFTHGWWSRNRRRLLAGAVMVLALPLAFWWGSRLGVAGPMPEVNVPVLNLASVRDGADAPPPVLHLDPAARTLVLRVELAYIEAESYRATLVGPAGAALWQEKGLRADGDGILNWALPVQSLQEGTYLLKLEAEPVGSTAPSVDLPFRISALRARRS